MKFWAHTMTVWRITKAQQDSLWMPRCGMDDTWAEVTTRSEPEGRESRTWVWQWSSIALAQHNSHIGTEPEKHSHRGRGKVGGIFSLHHMLVSQEGNCSVGFKSFSHKRQTKRSQAWIFNQMRRARMRTDGSSCQTLKNWWSMVRGTNRSINLLIILDVPTLKKRRMANRQEEIKMCICNQHYCCTKAIIQLIISITWMLMKNNATY